MQQVIRDIIQRNSRPLQPRPTGQRPVLAHLAGMRAVLFDIYGTLFISGSGDIGANSANNDTDQTEHGRRIVRDAFAAAKIPVPPDVAETRRLLTATIQEAHAQLRAAGIDFPEVDIVDIWRTVLQRTRGDGQWTCPTITDEMLKRLAAEYEVRSNPVWPMPGSAECLQALRDGGLLLGVVSNAQFYTPELFPALLDEEMRGLGFDSRMCWYSFEHRRAKPGTDLYLMARAHLESRGVCAGEVLFVGNDMLNDAAAAREVGFRTALFAGDERSLRLRDGDPRVEGVTPDLVIEHLNQLPPCVLSDRR